MATNKLENDLDLTYESKQVVIYLCLQSIIYKSCVEMWISLEIRIEISHECKHFKTI